MGALLYHVPGVAPPVTRAQLVEWGLDRLFASVPYHHGQPGPAGDGVILCDEPALAPLLPVYRPDEQEWIRRPDKYGRPVWVGRYREAPRPSAVDLDRPGLLDGERLQLADGAWWQVPRVRCLSPDGDAWSPLPSYVELNDEGQPRRGPIDERYAPLWEATAPYWDAFLAAAEELDPEAEQIVVKAPEEYLFDAAVEILAANYRIDSITASVLRLFKTTGHVSDVLWHACDCDVALALLLQKKTRTATTAAAAGGSDA